MNKILNKFKYILPILLVTSTISLSSAEASNSSILQNEAPNIIEQPTSGITSMANNPNIGLSPTQTIAPSGDGSLSKAEDYVEKKLFDVVGFFQSFVKPLTYVTFIISTIALLFGVITGSKSKFKGLLGMAFSIFVYVAVVFAPQIVEYFSAWLSVA